MGQYVQGYREGGLDWSNYFYQSLADTTPAPTSTTTGTQILFGQAAGLPIGLPGINCIAYSGTGGVGGTGTSPVIFVLPSGVEAGVNQIIIKDTAGGAAGANIIVSGLGGQTFNGASTYTISTAYGVAHLYTAVTTSSGTSLPVSSGNVSNVAWYTI